MQDEEITTEESLPETELNVPAADSAPAVSKVEGLTLEELNAFTGKQFPNKESALKSIKDTYTAVVRKPQPSVDTSQFVPRAEFEEATFYAKHPEYESQKDIISALAVKHGKTVSEVVEMDTFKTVFDKVKTADEINASKSVLHSNPRLGLVTDKMTQAQDALKASRQAAAAGDSVAAEQAYSAGKAAAVSAVMEAYQIGK